MTVRTLLESPITLWTCVVVFYVLNAPLLGLFVILLILSFVISPKK